MLDTEKKKNSKVKEKIGNPGEGTRRIRKRTEKERVDISDVI